MRTILIPDIRTTNVYSKWTESPLYTSAAVTEETINWRWDPTLSIVMFSNIIRLYMYHTTSKKHFSSLHSTNEVNGNWAAGAGEDSNNFNCKLKIKFLHQTNTASLPCPELLSRLWSCLAMVQETSPGQTGTPGLTRYLGSKYWIPRSHSIHWHWDLPYQIHSKTRDKIHPE